jgi:lysophospholipase L1-like esterase
MVMGIAFAAFAGLLIMGLGAAHAQTRTIAILGSSTAAGVGATHNDSSFAGRYGRHLAALNPAWKLVNLGVGGYTTYHVMPAGFKPPANRPLADTARNLTKVLALRPQALIICLPSNDIDKGYAASEYNANFDSLHAWAERAGVPTWVTSPLPRSALDSAKRNLLVALRARTLSRFGHRAINFYDSLGGLDGNYYAPYNSGDGIHTNDRGHKLLFGRATAADIPGAVTAVSLGVPAHGFPVAGTATRHRLFPDLGGGLSFIGSGPEGPRMDIRGRLLERRPGRR